MSLLLNNVSVNDVELYIRMGNEAIKKGDQDESMKWYLKGLSKAKELRNKKIEKDISNLIITLI
ncbi:MAG: hypothetical protein MK066_02105 [Crocinitomicaceae bacterium]|nr:hypothetical protein [Crocinitomicaceae bacterium]